MLVLGIDPGTATTGWGVIRLNGKAGPSLIAHGLIETEANGHPGKRFVEIYKQMSSLIAAHKPTAVAIEKIFFFVNAKTVISVSQAQGVLHLAAADAGVPAYEYAPGQVKKVVSGSGKADKKQMQKTIKEMFGVEAERNKKTHFDNAADAIAIAVCHAKLANAKLTSGSR